MSEKVICNLIIKGMIFTVIDTHKTKDSVECINGE